MGKCLILKNGNTGIDTDELTATPDKVLAPYTFGGAGSDEKQEGIIPTLGALTVTPTTSTQVIEAGNYLGGTITVPAFTMPPANMLKKGYVYQAFGKSVTGSFEGYVATPTDLYYRGYNRLGFGVVDGDLQTNQIYVGSGSTDCFINATAYFNFAGYSSLIIEGNIVSFNGRIDLNSLVGQYFPQGTYSSVALPLNTLQKSIKPSIRIRYLNGSIITRIRVQ